MVSRPLPAPAPAPTAAGRFAGSWGVVGVVLLLSRGALALLAPAHEAFRALPGLEGLLLGLLVVLPLGALKGRMVFERALAPRVVGRAFHLARRPSPLHAVLAPLFCLGLIHATRRRRTVGWAMVALIAGFIAVTRLLPQPYRGVVAAAVALGLGWGVAAVASRAIRALRRGPPDAGLDLPVAPA